MRTQRMMISCLLVLGFVILTGFNNIAGAADWPNWRGPGYNGISSEKDWNPLKIKDGVKPLWQASVGVGFYTYYVTDDIGRAHV